MIIGGLQRFTLLDFPGRMAASVFTQGCNFRCPYCHNPDLVVPCPGAPRESEEEILAFLASRRGTLEGIVVTGGEPTIHSDLPEFLRTIRSMGFAVKLDTNGSVPRVVKTLIETKLVDYVAMDIKTSPRLYAQAAGMNVCVEDIRLSVDIIVSSGVPHELRMTFLERFVPFSEIPAIAELAHGCRLFVVQPFQSLRTLDPRLLGEAQPSRDSMERARMMLEQRGVRAALR